MSLSPSSSKYYMTKGRKNTKKELPEDGVAVVTVTVA